MVYPKKNRDALKLFITSLFDFFAPRTCASCYFNLTATETFICNKCLSRLTKTDPIFLQHEYLRHFSHKQTIAGFTSLYVFEKGKEFQNIIHAIKYQNKFLTARYLGMLMGRALASQISGWNIDLIIPIPLHLAKTAERGYNQSLYIAKGLSLIVQIPLLKNAVKRKKYTSSQTLMSLSEREQNMSGAFSAYKQDIIKGKNLLLVDDVITTGATINECGKVLKQIGAKNVYAISAAIAE